MNDYPYPELKLLRDECDDCPRTGVAATQNIKSAISNAFGAYAKYYLAHGQHKPPARCKGQFVRELRLTFVSEAIGHFILSTNALKRDEASRILRWLLGKHPNWSTHWEDNVITATYNQRLDEMVEFFDNSERVGKATMLLTPKSRKKAA